MPDVFQPPIASTMSAKHFSCVTHSHELSFLLEYGGIRAVPLAMVHLLGTQHPDAAP